MLSCVQCRSNTFSVLAFPYTFTCSSQFLVCGKLLIEVWTGEVKEDKECMYIGRKSKGLRVTENGYGADKEGESKKMGVQREEKDRVREVEKMKQ